MEKYITSPKQALELFDLHSRYMCEEAKDRNYDSDAATSAYAKFSAKYEEMGIECVLEAQRIANTAWANHEKLEEMKARGVSTVVIPYDMDLDHLLMIEA